ncbi:MAG: hypothetical protein BWY31_03254 [Lentisphaerae bacterium ADurb.Bin242]|nr:MAG: hypothetical protein BWY31_03254 [Lentisphaerae bacterium ADurb.Bin242]
MSRSLIEMEDRIDSHIRSGIYHGAVVLAGTARKDGVVPARGPSPLHRQRRHLFHRRRSGKVFQDASPAWKRILQNRCRGRILPASDAAGSRRAFFQVEQGTPSHPEGLFFPDGFPQRLDRSDSVGRSRQRFLCPGSHQPGGRPRRGETQAAGNRRYDSAVFEELNL